MDSGIRYVKGIDLSPGEVEEARKRYEEARAKPQQTPLLTRCEFLDTPNLGLEEWKESQQYDVVTCMFALHYFFVSEAALKQFFHNVAINLKDGGYFIGTVPDGKRINECIRSRKVYSSPMLKIEARWKGAPNTFGSAYVCAIGDTVTGGEKGTEGSLEYLVYRNVLQGVAARYGLKPVLQYNDADLEGMFDDADQGQVLKHFAPKFPESDISLEKASALFTAFAFQKTVGNVTLPEDKKNHDLSAAAVVEKEKEKVIGGGLKRKQEKLESDSGGVGEKVEKFAAVADDDGDKDAAAKLTSKYKRPQIRRKAAPQAPQDQLTAG
jgi:mRNA (guanine-N7-)-methyltransferase